MKELECTLHAIEFDAAAKVLLTCAAKSTVD
jgi:hypothetical protein